MKFELKMPPCTITEFFNAVAREMGYEDTSELKYDCTKIEISRNIQDKFFECYATMSRETNSKLLKHEITADINLLLSQFGPKVNPNFKRNEIKVFDGFIIDTIQN